MRLKFEEVQIDEISKEKLADYIPKAAHSIGLMTAKRVHRGVDHPDYEKNLAKQGRRHKGIQKAVDKLANEEKEYKKLSYDDFIKGRIDNPTPQQHKEIGRRLKKAGVPGSGWHFKKAKEMQKNVKEETLDEVLTKKTPVSTWIHDFVHSDNPKFAGKSSKKRQKMAIAAYYANQRNEDLAIPMLEDGKKKKKKVEREQADTPMTFPNLSVDVNTGRNV